MSGKGKSLKDATQEKVMAWCGDDQSLRAKAVDPTPGSRFSIRVQTATGECRVSSPERGVERIVVEREIALDGEQLKMLRKAGVREEEGVNRMLSGLIAARSSLISYSLRRTGDRMTVGVSHPVYVDGLTRHSFLSALADVDRFATMVDLSLAGLKSVARMRRETNDAVKKSQREFRKSLPPTPPKSQNVPTPEPEYEPTPPPAMRSGPRRCNRCGSIAAAGDRFCAGCGANVQDATAQPSPPRTTTTLGRFCLRCGNRLEKGHRFCRRCGAPTAS